MLEIPLSHAAWDNEIQLCWRFGAAQEPEINQAPKKITANKIDATLIGQKKEKLQQSN